MQPVQGTYLDEQVFLLLSQDFSLCKKVVNKVLAKKGITLAEYSLLRILQNTPNITASSARKRLFTSAPSIAQLVKSTTQKGFIRRGSDTVDTRRQPIQLTKKGQSMVINARQVIQQSLSKLAIPPTVLHALKSNLSILFTSLSSYEE